MRNRLSLLLLLCLPLAAQRIITTVAGRDWVFTNVGQSALNAPIGTVTNLATDRDGNLYLADEDNHLVLRVDAVTNIVTVVAGNGIPGFSGDGSAATSASLNGPSALAFDAAGNLYVADSLNERIRKITPDGNIATIAGTGTIGYSGDGGPAGNATIYGPGAMTVDASGNIYFCDVGNNRVRKIDSRGVISLVAGNGQARDSGDGGSATLAAINGPRGVAIDGAGAVLVSSFYGNRVRRIANGTIGPFAGSGVPGFSGDGGQAAAAAMAGPVGLAIDAKGNVLISDSNNCRIRQVSAAGVIQTIAGDDTCQPSTVDVDPLETATLFFQQGLALDRAGNLFAADSANHIKKIAPDGGVSRVAGNGQYRRNQEGIPVTQAVFDGPRGLAADNKGGVYVASRNNSFLYRLSPEGMLEHVAGRGAPGGGLEGAAAVLTVINEPYGVAVDPPGNIYFSDLGNNRIAKIGTDGTMRTLAGRYTPTGYSGDGGPASQASINFPLGVAADGGGNVYFADSNNHRVRKIAKDGTISTVAGNGNAGFSCDNCAATTSALNGPVGVALDSGGNLYIADQSNHRIRKVDGKGVITTIAGNGTNASSGDGGPATQALVSGPTMLAVDSAGNVYFSEFSANRVRMISAATGVIATVAGNGVAGYAGDGGPAIGAALHGPAGLAVNAAGSLFIADAANDRIRAVITAAPSFTLSRSSVTFTATARGAAPAPQRVSLASFLGSSLSSGLPYTIAITGSGDTSWLQVTPARNIMPIDLTLSVEPGTLSAGSYQATVTVNAPGAQPAQRAFDVALTVTAAAALSLGVHPESLTFSFAPGSASATAQLSIANQGGGAPDFTAAASTAQGGNWLSVAPVSGTVTANANTILTVTVNPKGLAQGAYSGAITVTSAATGQKLAIPVTTTVTNAVSHTLLSQSGVTFSAVAAGGRPLPQTVGVLNTGQGSMTWQASAAVLAAGEPQWISVSPGSGSVATPLLDVSQLTITVDPTGLAPGDHYGRVQVSAAGADNSPQFISVLLSVLPAGSPTAPDVRPTGLVFTGVQGGSPGSQNILIGDPGAAPISYNSSRLTVDGGAWFVHVPTSGVVTPSQPGKIVVQPDFTQLAPGIANGAITLQFADGSVSVVKILTVVAPAGQGKAGEPGAGCSASQLTIQPTSSGQTLTVRLSQPVAMEVQVIDNCGQPLTRDRGGAAVSMSFSNGDRTVGMIHTGQGKWSNTWQPLNASTGPIRVTVTAFLATASGSVVANQVDLVATTAGSAATPSVAPHGVLNGASFQKDVPVAPGSLISIYGSQLAAGPGQSFTATPVPTQLNGTQVRLNDKPLPLFYSSDGQVNAQIPFTLPVNTQLQLLVTRGNALSVPETLSVAAAQPAIFATNQQGTGQGAITNAVTNRLAAPDNPVHTDDVIAIYCTGLGAVSPALAEGTAASLTVLSSTVETVSVTIGGKAAKVNFAGLAPGFVGLYQVNAVVPAGVAAGDSVPVTIGAAGQIGPAATIAVR